MSLPKEVMDIINTIGDDSCDGTGHINTNDTHRIQLAKAVESNNKEKLLELLENSKDSDIQWVKDFAKSLANSPITYALMSFMSYNKD